MSFFPISAERDNIGLYGDYFYESARDDDEHASFQNGGK